MSKKKKILILGIIILLLIFSIIFILSSLNKNKIAVLGYHGIVPKAENNFHDNLIVDQEKFEKELKLLKNMGYHSMTLDEFYCWKTGQCKKNHKSVLITFDDGYINNYKYAFDLLKKYDMKAVVFFVGKYSLSNSDIHMDINLIKSILEKYKNIEFASHSYDMHSPKPREYDEVNNDIQKMKKITNSKYYAYPHGDYTDGYIKALKDNDYIMAFTFGPGKEHRKSDIKDDNYKIPRLNISNDMSLLKFVLRMILPM